MNDEHKFQPKTYREDELDRPEGSKPCIHFGDEDAAVLQVHHRGDQPVGFMVSISTPPQMLLGIPIKMPDQFFYLTSNQAQELMTYFKQEL